jgi:hypothetical protein
VFLFSFFFGYKKRCEDAAFDQLLVSFQGQPLARAHMRRGGPQAAYRSPSFGPPGQREEG